MSLRRFPDPLAPWKAVWIWHPQATRDGYAVVRFRKRFELSTPVADPVFWVSADERFILYLDGRRIARGPARSDPARWIATPVRPGPLVPGAHVLAATVVKFGSDHSGWGQMGARAGFLLRAEPDADGRLGELVNTDATWRCHHDTSRTPNPPELGDLKQFMAVGDGERVDGARLPWGCEQPGYDDREWLAAKPVETAAPLGLRDPSALHTLLPDPLPPMDEEERRFARVAECDAQPEAFAAWLAADRPVTVPARSRCRVLLDYGELTNAYTTLTVSRGAESRVRLVAAEALWRKAGDKLTKDDRDETKGKHAWGHADVFVPSGSQHETFAALWFRSYRYVELLIETAYQPLTLERIRSEFTGFPLRQRASFQADAKHAETYRRIWEVSWRTARLCAHETYFDCPHYEQLQYVGDTRIQALFSYLVAHEDRLARKAIEDFWSSRIPEGLTCSRHPSRTPQVIPPFSLYWIGMLRDFLIYRGDAPFLRTYLHTAREVLAWFDARRGRQGLLGPLEYWGFLDWVPGWPNGVPPGAETGGSAALSLLCACAADWMAELEHACGYAELAGRWRRLNRDLIQSTLPACWDERRGLLADTPEKKTFSVHANVQAILAGAFPKEKTIEVLEKILAADAEDLTRPGTAYFRFYVAQALKAAGMRARWFEIQKSWESLLDGTGLSTWPETDRFSRSDCHAWSCTPSIELLETILGVQPDPKEHGYGAALVTPALGPLSEASGAIPTPHGEIKLSLHREDRNRLRGKIETPIPVRVVREATGRGEEFGPGTHSFTTTSA